jgi:ATP-binding cassette subfamily F protein 3
MREALAQALTDFAGGLVVVAHDRHLLAAATDQWWLVADGRVVPFDGDLADYKEWAREYHARGRRSQAEGAPLMSRRDERRVEALARQREARARKPYEERLRAIETELASLERHRAEDEAFLASQAAYVEESRSRLQETLKRRADVAARIAALEEEWLWAQAEMEREVNRARE